MVGESVQISGKDIDSEIEKYNKKEAFNKRLNESIDANVENKKKIFGIEENISKLTKELCEGPDCLKKKVEDKFEKVDSELGKLREESETFICDSCGKKVIRRFDSFCPNCAYPIPEWLDESTGLPIISWSPYWKGKEKEYGLE